jgi:predicted AAA+ superfamily ATPase
MVNNPKRDALITILNEKHELKGLLEACRDLDLITYAQEEELRTNGLTVSVMPVWKWLLLSDMPDVSHNRRP